MIVVDTGPLAVTNLQGNDQTRDLYGLPITPREELMLRLLAEGYTGLQVADSCGISKLTFWNHIKNAKARIGAATTIRAVVLYAIEQAERSSPRSPVARADSRAVTFAPPDPIQGTA